MKVYVISQKLDNKDQIMVEIEELGHKPFWSRMFVSLKLRQWEADEDEKTFLQECEAFLLLDLSDEESKNYWWQYAQEKNKKIFFSLEELEDYTGKNQKWFPGRCCE